MIFRVRIQRIVFLLWIGTVLSISYVRVLDTFKCDPTVQSTEVSLANTFTTVDWTFGFWIKVPWGQTNSLPIMRIVNSVHGSDYLYMLSATPITYQFMWGGFPVSVLNGASALDDDNYYSIRTGVSGNNWNYISFVFFFDGEYTYPGVALNNGEALSTFVYMQYSQDNTKIIIGSDSITNNCSMTFQINRLDVFNQPYNVMYYGGAQIDNIYSPAGGPVAALYKLNRYAMARKLTNIINPGLYEASVTTDLIKKQALNFPILITNDFFNLDGQEYEIRYPPNLMQKSPNDNSYVVVCTFVLMGKAKLASMKLSGESITVSPLILHLYERRPAADLNYKLVGDRTTVDFQAFTRKIEVAADNVYSVHSSNNFPSPSTQSVFTISSSTALVTQIKNYYFLTSKTVTYCTSPPLSCSSAMPLSTAFLDDDIHGTYLAKQAGSYLAYVVPAEVMFIHSPFIYYHLNNIGWSLGNSNDIFINSVFTPNLKRFENNDMKSVTLTSSAGIGENNCNDDKCSYCEAGVCTLCKLRYYFSGSVCVFCPTTNVYDHITKTCLPALDTRTNLDELDAFINTHSQNNVVVTNIIFDMRVVLNDPASSLYTYVVYFNSLEYLDYDPFEQLTYTASQVLAGLNKLTSLFSEHQALMANIGPILNYTVRTGVAEKAQFRIPNPDLFKLGNDCFSPNWRYLPETNFVGRCVRICAQGSYYDSVNDYCEPCMENCADCSSANCCNVCASGYQPDGTGCILSSPTPGSITTTFTETNQLSTISVNTVPTAAFTGDGEYLKTLASSQSIKEASLVTTTIESDELINGKVQEIVCRAGFTSLKSECVRCPRGCLSCPEILTCSQCDSNYWLSDSDFCVQRNSSLVDNPSNSTESEIEECETCFQEHGSLSRGCTKCRESCACTSSQTAYDGSFTILCHNVTLDRDNLALMHTHEYYNLRAGREGFQLRVFLKRSAKALNFTIDELLVKNTTGCIMPKERHFELVANSSAILTLSPLNISISQKQRAAAIGEIVVNSIGFFSFSLANTIIGFLQFNKVFYFLSTLEIQVGGFYDYINFNIYNAANPTKPWSLFSFQKFEFDYLYETYQANKLVSGYTIQMFFLQVCFGFCFVWIGKILRQLKIYQRLMKIGFQMEKCGKSFLFILSRKYLPVFAVSMCFLLRVHLMIIPLPFQIISMIVLLLMIQFPLLMRYKILTYLENHYKSTLAYLNTFKSEKQYPKNQIYLRAKMAAELFFVIKILAIYFLRKYKLAALVITIVVIAIEMVISLRLARTMHPFQLAIMGLGFCSLLGFVLLMLLKYLGFGQFYLLFDCFYLVSNVAKLVEHIAMSISVYLTNKADAREETILTQRRQERADIASKKMVNIEMQC